MSDEAAGLRALIAKLQALDDRGRPLALSLQDELAALEATDPEVARARDQLDQTIFEITRLPPKRRFRKDLGGRSAE